MMKNIIIVLAILIVSIGIAGAIDLGDKLTQSQVDAIDFKTVDLKCRFNGLNILSNNEVIKFNFDCLSLYKNNTDGKYYVIRTPIPEYYYFQNYKDCRERDNRVNCILEIRTTVLNLYKSDKDSLRATLMGYQTKTNDISDNDFDFTNDL